MKSLYKQNINPLNPSDQYGLRKSIPFRLSSILKNSNKIQQKKTLAQMSQQYQNDKLKIKRNKPKTPLIKIQQENSKNNLLFFKNPRSTINIDTNNKNISLISTKQTQLYKKVSDDKSNQNQEQYQLDAKLMELINMISVQEKNKLHRCHSSLTLNIKQPNSPLINFRKQNYNEKNLLKPQQNTEISEYSKKSELNIKRPSFLNKKPRYSEQIQDQSRVQNKYLAKSSYFQGQYDLKVNQKRMNHYQPCKKIQTPQLRLCINCQSYVNQNTVNQHEQKCLGFKIILKMSQDELIDFLNEKIEAKLHKLKQTQNKINELRSKQGQNYGEMLNMCQQRSRIDKILDDLDGIRLKALKKFHTKNIKPKQTKEQTS